MLAREGGAVEGVPEAKTEANEPSTLVDFLDLFGFFLMTGFICRFC